MDGHKIYLELDHGIGGVGSKSALVVTPSNALLLLHETRRGRESNTPIPILLTNCFSVSRQPSYSPHRKKYEPQTEVFFLILANQRAESINYRCCRPGSFRYTCPVPYVLVRFTPPSWLVLCDDVRLGNPDYINYSCDTPGWSPFSFGVF